MRGTSETQISIFLPTFWFLGSIVPEILYAIFPTSCPVGYPLVSGMSSFLADSTSDSKHGLDRQLEPAHWSLHRLALRLIFFWLGALAQVRLSPPQIIKHLARLAFDSWTHGLCWLAAFGSIDVWPDGSQLWLGRWGFCSLRDLNTLDVPGVNPQICRVGIHISEYLELEQALQNNIL